MTKKTTPAKTEVQQRTTAIDLARELSTHYALRLPLAKISDEHKITEERFQQILQQLRQNKILQEVTITTSRPSKISSVTDIGALVRASRRKRKLSQQAFADLAGVGRRFLSELENGKGTLEFDKVLKVAAASGIDLFVNER